MNPFIYTFIAGFATMIGVIPILFNIKQINKFICLSLSFASGVMFMISIIDLIPESLILLSSKYQGFIIILLCLIFVFLGIIISMIIDYYIDGKQLNNKLYKVGIISMLVIILHNIPEGIATFIAGSTNQTLALSLTIAIALHNIPEGISIAIPIYYSTKSKLKAILYTFISSISEPLGALIAYIFLKNINTNIFLGLLFSLIAGIMIQISICQLLPTSKSYNYKAITYMFFIIGVLFVLLKFLF